MRQGQSGREDGWMAQRSTKARLDKFNQATHKGLDSGGMDTSELNYIFFPVLAIFILFKQVIDRKTLVLKASLAEGKRQRLKKGFLALELHFAKLQMYLGGKHQQRLGKCFQLLVSIAGGWLAFYCLSFLHFCAFSCPDCSPTAG